MGAEWAQVRPQLIPLFKQTFANFQRHNGQWLAAAIAYFTMFAIAPLLLVIVEIAGAILGHQQTLLNQFYSYLAHSAGKQAADGIHAIVSASAHARRAGPLAQIIGWIMFLVAAAGLFGALQQALNTVWDVGPKKRTLMETLRERAVPFLAVLGIVILLFASLAVNAVLTVAAGAMAHVAPFFPTLMKIADFVVSAAIIAVLFAFLFRYLPDCEIDWQDVWLGGAVSSVLFVIGQFLLGWYLGRAGISSTFGAFGGLVVFLVWVNYSAQIMLLGAEFTHAFGQRFGSAKSSTSTRGEVDASATARPYAQPRVT